MPDVKGVITKKIGPLPVWAYVAGGAAAVFLLGKFKGGGSSGGGAANTIRVPTLAPGTGSSIGDGSISSGGNAVGSPGQNGQGGSDTQPGGNDPYWYQIDDGWMRGGGGPLHDAWFAPAPGSWGNKRLPPSVPSTPSGSNPGGATAGPPPLPFIPFPQPTAGELAKEPAGGWTSPPPFQQVSPTQVIVPGGGVVNPGNHLVGYSNPVTGEFRQTPFSGGVPIWS